jgi:multidrug efflux system membrane fusion protein
MQRSYVLAAVIAVAAGAWVLSGQFSGASDASRAQVPPAVTPAAPAVQQVRAERLTAQPMVNHLTITGRTAAARTVEVKAETRGTVAAVLVERGRRVAKGEIIVKLAVEDRQAKLDQARSLLVYREAEFSAARTLASRGFNPELKLAEWRSLVESARAELRKAEVELAYTEIKAPFDGVLDRRPVELGQYVDTGNVIAAVVDLHPIKLVGQISERYIAHIQPGAKAEITLLGGLKAEGTLSYVSATADAATRTFRIEFESPNPNGAIVEGLTAEIRLPIAQQLAYRVSPAVLSLGDDGSIGVKTVDVDGKVAFHRVTILDDSPDGVWLGGLPGEITLITVGHEFVVAGEPVQPVFGAAEKGRS